MTFIVFLCDPLYKGEYIVRPPYIYRGGILFSSFFLFIIFFFFFFFSPRFLLQSTIDTDQSTTPILTYRVSNERSLLDLVQCENSTGWLKYFMNYDQKQGFTLEIIFEEDSRHISNIFVFLECFYPNLNIIIKTWSYRVYQKKVIWKFTFFHFGPNFFALLEPK